MLTPLQSVSLSQVSKNNNYNCKYIEFALLLGCDTGFGHLLAKKLSNYGFTVFAGCLQPNGEGAKKLLREHHENLIIVPLDVTKDESVEAARKLVDNLIEDKSKLKIHLFQINKQIIEM